MTNYNTTWKFKQEKTNYCFFLSPYELSDGEKTDFKVIHSNCQGFISKQASIEEIINKKSPDVYVCNETALKGKRKVNMKDYFSFCKNREKHMGGVATIVSSHLRSHTVKVA